METDTKLAAELPLASAPEKPDVIPATVETKAVDSKPPAVPEKAPSAKKYSKNSLERDIALAEVEKEKKLSFIKAWEESEKTKVQNRTQKELAAVATWENTRKANVEAKIKNIEEEMEREKAEYGEKMKNKVALIHKQADERRAIVEAKKGEEMLKAEEMAAKHRATGFVPMNFCGCMGG